MKLNDSKCWSPSAYLRKSDLLGNHLKVVHSGLAARLSGLCGILKPSLIVGRRQQRRKALFNHTQAAPFEGCGCSLHAFKQDPSLTLFWSASKVSRMPYLGERMGVGEGEMTWIPAPTVQVEEP